MNDFNNSDDSVGYRKPPKTTRFKPGQSGNPKGRPKGVVSLAKTVQKALREKVTVVENGRRCQVSKFDAAVTQLANKAVKGDIRSIQMLLNLAPLLDGSVGATPIDSEMDLALMDGVLRRLLPRSGENVEGNSKEQQP